MATPLQEEIINDEIHSQLMAAKPLLDAIRHTNEDWTFKVGSRQEIVPADELAKLEVVAGKLRDCYVPIVEITEQDLAMDRYWDKSERREKVREYASRIEQRIRRKVLMQEHGDQMERIRQIASTHPDEYAREIFGEFLSEQYQYAAEASDYARYAF